MITENFLNLDKDTTIQIQEGHQLDSTQSKSTSRHTKIKLSKDKGKERIVKASREKKQHRKDSKFIWCQTSHQKSL